MNTAACNKFSPYNGSNFVHLRKLSTNHFTHVTIEQRFADKHNSNRKFLRLANKTKIGKKVKTGKLIHTTQTFLTFRVEC